MLRPIFAFSIFALATVGPAFCNRGWLIETEALLEKGSGLWLELRDTLPVTFTVPFVCAILSCTPTWKLVVFESLGITKSDPSGCATVVVERERERLVEPLMVGRKAAFAIVRFSRAVSVE